MSGNQMLKRHANVTAGGSNEASEIVLTADVSVVMPVLQPGNLAQETVRVISKTVVYLDHWAHQGLDMHCPQVPLLFLGQNNRTLESTPLPCLLRLPELSSTALSCGREPDVAGG